MEIKILKEDEGYIKFTVKKTDPHTLFNVLREELLKNEKVDFAGYWRDESFYESVIFQIRMKEKTSDPIQAIYEALDKLKEQTNEFMDVCKLKIA
ncbi:MAG: RpoL/Rpb11 RNA polymerase subunit family protein [Candidatus Heimdallarchaeaceae archaeon]